MRGGFTLVEVMVAVGIAALLILGVSSATQATVRTSERQKADARKDELRARVVELLRQDWRGRVKLEKPLRTPPEGTRALVISTTSDSISSSNARASRLVTWITSEKGLFRREDDLESASLPGPVVLEFWDGVAWRPEPTGTPQGLRVVLPDPTETVVLR